MEFLIDCYWKNEQREEIILFPLFASVAIQDLSESLEYGIIYGFLRTYFSPNYYFCGKNNDKNMKLNRIKEVLEDKGISQTWLSKKLGKSFSTVNSYVCNRSQPNLNTLLEISKLLAVDLKDLIADTEEREYENCKWL